MGGISSKQKSDYKILEDVNINVENAINILRMIEIEMKISQDNFNNLNYRINLATYFSDANDLIKKSIEKMQNARLIGNSDYCYIDNTKQETNEYVKKIYTKIFEYFDIFENCCTKFNKVLKHFINAGWQCNEIFFKAYNISLDFNINAKTLGFMLETSSKVEYQMNEILSELSPIIKFDPKQNVVDVISPKYFENKSKPEYKNYWQTVRDYIYQMYAFYAAKVSKFYPEFGENEVQMIKSFGEYIAYNVKGFCENKVQMIKSFGGYITNSVKGFSGNDAQKLKNVAQSGLKIVKEAAIYHAKPIISFLSELVIKEKSLIGAIGAFIWEFKFWWILIPTIVCTVAGVISYFTLSKFYSSENSDLKL